MGLVFHSLAKLLPIAFSILLNALLSFQVCAESACDPEISRLISAQGRVDAYLANVSQWAPAHQGQPYCGDDKVRTGALSRAVLSMEKGIATFLALDELTLLNFVKNAGRVMLSIESGQVHIRSHTPSRFDVTTPFVNAGIEGTVFLVKADDHSAEISVFEGKVRVYNAQGEIMIVKGQTALTQAGAAPILKQIDLKPDDGVRWAMYYPPIIDFTALGALSNDPAIQMAHNRYQTGDITGAIEQLSRLIEQQPSANLLAVQAGLLLTIGRVDKAEPLIQRAQSLESNHPALYALQAIIALTRNDKDQARQLAQTAIASNPESPIPYVAMSYVEQAAFDLDLALEAIEKALQLAQQSGLIYCRKAELLASKNEIKPARAAAEQALALNPQLARTHVVLGFVELMETHTESAGEHFRQAIELDSADPLAHFGQALVTIRGGDMTIGIAQLEIAASLDPNNSLIRSYLGKAYYEQKRDNVASLQFELAKNNDPKDPTPYFYSAVQKHAQNRPVEALLDMEKAIELNDNRAVYRSKQMLDSDLASRGAAIGRIYNEIGFGPRALVEAWTALADDPGDYSAHRLLSDTYSSLPRSDLARTSELLQSQMLQPINTSPVQPRLAESTKFLAGNLGPSALSLNEFNPLFERNRFSTLVSGQVGSNNTYSDEVVHSGLWNDWSYSLGQFHSQSEGYRVNNAVDVNIYNVFIQGRLTSELSMQGEYRHRNSTYGDLTSKFFQLPANEQIASNNRYDFNQNNTYRIGFNWTPTPSNKLLGSFTYLDNNQSTFYKPYEIIDQYGRFKVESSRDDSDITGNNAEFQYQTSASSFKAIIGGGLGAVKITANSYLSQENQNNGYIYSYFNFPKSVQWILGGSFTSVDDDIEINRSYNPKIGIIWHVTPLTIIRAAGFKTVNYSIITGASLEPTQIAGFNQFYSDRSHISANRYGLGLDQQLSKTINLGFEASKRRLTYPLFDPPTHWTETQYRGYLSWAPYSRFSINIEYLYEDFVNKYSSYYDIPRNTRTSYLPINFAYFDPNGIFFSFKTTKYWQKTTDNIQSESDEALFLDAGIGFRFPKRLGIMEIQLQNLLNQSYRYEDYSNRDPDELSKGMPTSLPFAPEFTVSAQLTFSF